jgi:hypothetical protein
LLERFQLPDGQQHRNLVCLARLLDTLAYFQAAVAGHVNIENNQIGMRFADFFESG